MVLFTGLCNVVQFSIQLVLFKELIVITTQIYANEMVGERTQGWIKSEFRNDFYETVCKIFKRATVKMWECIRCLTLLLSESNMETLIWCSSNFWVCWQKPMVWPFKWNLFSSTFAWYHLFFNILQNEIWDFICFFLSFFIYLDLWKPGCPKKAFLSVLGCCFL